MRPLLFLVTLLLSFSVVAQDTVGVMTISYYENGNKRSEGAYYEDYKIGLWQTWYENGTLRSRENYITDRKVVAVIKKDGLISLGYNLEFSKFFADSSGVFEGKSEWFYPNGQRCSEEVWTKNAVSIKHWSENGKRQKVVEDDNGVPLGVMENLRFNYEMNKELIGAWNAKNSNVGASAVLQVVLGADRKPNSLKMVRSTGFEDIDNLILDKANAETSWNVCRVHNLPVTQIATIVLKCKRN